MNKVPPQNIEAEQSVIGACIMDNQVIPEVMATITTSDFYRTAHQQIWAAIVKLTSERKPVDVITLTTDLRDKGLLDEVGGASYLMYLPDAAPSVVNAPYYAGLVKEKSARRSLISLGEMAKNEGYSEDSASISDSISTIVKSLLSIAETTGKKSDCKHISEIVADIHNSISEKIVYGKDGEFVKCEGIFSDTFVPTGFTDLDRIIGGLIPAYLHIIAGRPGMGKSTLAFCMAIEQALRNLNVCIFSFEISKILTVLRLLARVSGVGTSDLMRGPLSEAQYQRLTESTGRISGLPIWIYGRRLSTMEIRMELNRKIMELGKKPDAVYIDRLEFINERQLHGERRDLYLGRITNELTAIATDLEVPIVLLVQLSRECEKRQDKRPMLSDLRDSGAIEQDAKMVLFAYREEYYNPKPDNKGKGEIIIAKDSDGGTGIVKVSFRERIPSFDNLARTEE